MVVDVDVLRVIFGVVVVVDDGEVVDDGVVDDDTSFFGAVVVVSLTDMVWFVSFIGCQFSSVVASISLFTIPVLHSGTHITNSIARCVQMSNG